MNAMARMAESENAAMKRHNENGLARDLDKVLSDLYGYLSEHDRKDMMVFVSEVCKESGVELCEVLGRARHQPTARVRQYAIWKLRREHFTAKQIQALFKFDRSCVGYAERKIDKILGGVK